MCAKISKNAYMSTWINNPFTAGPWAAFTPYYGYKKQRDKEYAASLLMGSEPAIAIYSAGEEEQRAMHTATRKEQEMDADLDKFEAEQAEQRRLAEEEASRRQVHSAYNPIKGAQRALAHTIGKLKSGSFLGSGTAGKKSLLGE